MDSEFNRGDKESMLVKELSNVGYGLLDPIDLNSLTAILKQKSVGAGQPGRKNGPRDR